jgi:hypothetical protein
MRLGSVLALVVTSALADPNELIKPAPDVQAQPYRERLQSLLVAKYPGLAVKKIDGVVVVTLLFNPDGTLAGNALDVLPHAPAVLTVSEEQFARFGAVAEELRYIGASHLELPLNSVVVAFAGRDTRQIDRALVERYFSKTLRAGGPLNESMWILLDHGGIVVRTGTEAFSPTDLRSLLERRYPGISTSDMTVAPLIGSNGKPLKNSRQEVLQLYCVWLTADSPIPRD